MQIPKENIRNTLLNHARKEFNSKGFLKANMRTIAYRSGISTGNIYNYFPNKDALFYEIVRPVLDEIENALVQYEYMDILNDEHLWSLEYHFEFIEKIAEFLDKNREQLKLLLFKSQDSDLENYREEFIERYTEIMIQSMEKIRVSFPGALKDVSNFFLHNLSSLYINIIFELLMHDLSHDKMLKNLKEFMLFLFNGWDHFIDKEKIFNRE